MVSTLAINLAQVTNLLLPLTIKSLSKGVDSKLKKVAKQMEKQVFLAVEKTIEQNLRSVLELPIHDAFQQQFSQVFLSNAPFGLHVY